MLKRKSAVCKRESKKSLLFFLILLLAVKLFAYGGKMWGEKNLRLVKTSWFDIIYPARSEESAAILYEFADKVYEEVTAQYDMQPQFRMPVVIVPGVEDFNAFWAAVPYNHIVLYDTGVSGNSELAVFSQTLLSTFRHELTHAVTYNMKSRDWFAIDKVFGDFLAPGMLMVTTGMAEGATVTSESAAGEGRLNDEFAKHYVKQAKIEGKFPSYHDVSGSADVTPGGAPYFFNGAFHNWLQENYGLKAYADFWYRVVNGKDAFISKSFKKVYGIKLKKAWNLFEEAYQVPAVEADPLKAGFVLNLTDLQDGLFNCLSAGGDKLVWTDRYGSKLFYAEKKDLDSLPAKAHKLFSLSGLDSARVSQDGRFIAASYSSENSAFVTSRLKIYDFKKDRLYTSKESGLKEACIIPAESGDYYLVAQKYEAQHYSIEIFKVLFGKDGGISALEPYRNVVMAQEINPFAFTAGSSSTFAYLKKDRLDFSLCISDFQGQLVKEYFFPKGMAVRSLSYDSESQAFYFSYAEKGTLPRLGKLQASDGSMFKSSSDISGGIFEPVCVGGNIFYIAKFYRSNRLFALNTSVLEEAGLALSSEKYESSGKAGNLENSDLLNTPENSFSSIKSQLPSEPFRKLPYLLRGILLPFGSYTSDYFGKNAGYTLEANTFPFGVTYITGAPWTSGSSDLYQFTAGWNLLSNSFGTSLNITNGTDTSLFVNNIEIKSEFDSSGWKQSGASLVSSGKVQFGKISTITISNSMAAFVGRQDTMLKELEPFDSYAFWDSSKIGSTAPTDSTVYYELLEMISLQYSNIIRVGPGRNEYAGFAIGAGLGGRYDATLERHPRYEYVDLADFSAALRIRLPRLIPLRSNYGYTCNLPITMDAILFPSTSIYGYACEKDYEGYSFFDAKIETTLFGMEIQKALPGIEVLYLNDFSINLGYACTGDAKDVIQSGFKAANLGKYFLYLVNGEARYLDSIFLRGGVEFTPNAGLFAKSNYKMEVFTRFSFFLHSDKERPLSQSWKLFLGSSLSF